MSSDLSPFDRKRDGLQLLRLQNRADLQIQRDVLVPRVLLGVAHGVLPIHPADVRTLCVDGATLACCIVVPASAVATIQKLGFCGNMYVLAAQPALGAGKGGGWRDMAMHIKILPPRRGTVINWSIGWVARAYARAMFLSRGGIQARFLSARYGCDILDALFRCQYQIAVFIQNRRVDHGLEQLSKFD